MPAYMGTVREWLPFVACESIMEYRGKEQGHPELVAKINGVCIYISISLYLSVCCLSVCNIAFKQEHHIYKTVHH